MNQNLVEELQKQMNRERQNAQIYFYVASAFENQSYDGFAKFFRKQAQDELGHAQKFCEFLISKRIMPEYSELPKPEYSEHIPTLTRVVALVERDTTGNLKSLYDMAEGVDPQVCALLDWFLLEQIEEETWSQDLADLISRTDATGWLILDEKYGNM